MVRRVLLLSLFALPSCTIELLDRAVPDDVPVMVQPIDGVVVLAPGQVTAIGDRLVVARPQAEALRSVGLAPRRVARVAMPRARTLLHCLGCNRPAFSP